MVDLIQYIDEYLGHVIPSIPCFHLSNKKIHALAHTIGRDFYHSQCQKTEENILFFVKRYLRNHLIARMMQEPAVFLQMMQPYLSLYEKLNTDLYVKDSFLNRYYFWEAIYSGIFDYKTSKSVDENISYFYHLYMLGTLKPTKDYLEYFKKFYHVAYSNQKIPKIRKKSKSYKISFFDMFLGIERALIEKVLERLSWVKPQYYQIFIKRHGESLNEWNVMNQKDNLLYHEALRYFERVLNGDVKKWFETSVGRTLYLRHPNTPAYEINDIVSFYHDFFPKRYHILLKRHGSSFLEWNKLLNEEQNLYTNTNKDIARLLKMRSLHFGAARSFCKNVFLENPDILTMIKKKKQGVDNQKIIAGSSITEEQLYEIFAQNILLFGYKAPKIIFEILISTPYGIEYLKNSNQFLYLFNMRVYRTEQILNLERYMLRNHPDIQARAEKELMSLFGIDGIDEKHAKIFSVEKKEFVSKPVIKKERKISSVARDFFSNFPGEDPILVTRIVERFQKTYLHFYDVIIERHDKDLLCWHTLDSKKNVKYHQAISKVQELLAREDLEAWLNDEIKDNFFTRLPNVSADFIRNMLPNYRVLKPQQYNIVIARHNEDLLGFNKFHRNSESNKYYNAIKYFSHAFYDIEQNIPKFQALLWEALRENKSMIPLIQDCRKGMSVSELVEKYQMDSEQIYAVFAKCLFAFGYDCVSMIQEILTNASHGMEYLHHSTHFKAMIDGKYLSKLNILDVPQYMFPDNSEYQEYLQRELKRYYPTNKKTTLID